MRAGDGCRCSAGKAGAASASQSARRGLFLPPTWRFAEVTPLLHPTLHAGLRFLYLFIATIFWVLGAAPRGQGLGQEAMQPAIPLHAVPLGHRVHPTLAPFSSNQLCPFLLPLRAQASPRCLSPASLCWCCWWSATCWWCRCTATERTPLPARQSATWCVLLGTSLPELECNAQQPDCRLWLGLSGLARRYHTCFHTCVPIPWLGTVGLLIEVPSLAAV